MCSSAECVPSLLDTGAGSVLATLASSSDPEMLLGGCQALANMLACMAEEAGTVAKAVNRAGSPVVNRAGSPVVSRPASPFSQTSAEEDEERRPGRGATEPEGAPSRAPPPEPEGAPSSAVSSTDPLGRVRDAVRVTDQLHADGLPHCMLMASLIRCARPSE